MPKFSILIIEDEKNIQTFMGKVLKRHDYRVLCADTGAQGLELIRSQCPDIVLLDLGLPDMNGDEIIREVRTWTSTPIIVISARTAEREKVLALDLGADDYITKPFNPLEVIARVKSQLRRYTSLGGAEKGPGLLTVGPIAMDDGAKQVTVDGEPVALTPIEYNILRLLMTHPGQVFSSAQIYEQVWNDPAYGSENTVAVHIRHLREKIEIDPADPRYLKVVWGLGYKMDKGGI